MKIEFVFVILHYMAMDETIKCVESIQKKCCNNMKRIIIVDNDSKNGSGNILKEKYKLDEEIIVIINQENLGFARGNNVGFKYAKQNFNPDFIIMCNNDTIVLQDNFCDIIKEEYRQSIFAVLGPKILLRDNKVNGLKLKMPSYRQVRNKLIKTEYDLMEQYIFILKYPRWIYHKIKMKKMKNSQENKFITEKYHQNIVLHGCFWIFSKEYIDLFDGINDKTFLYHEEELLALRLKQYNLKSVYNPELVIYHNEDASTNAITKTERKKKIFVDKNIIKSIKVLMKEMKYHK